MILLLIEGCKIRSVRMQKESVTRTLHSWKLTYLKILLKSLKLIELYAPKILTWQLNYRLIMLTFYYRTAYLWTIKKCAVQWTRFWQTLFLKTIGIKHFIEKSVTMKSWIGSNWSKNCDSFRLYSEGL